MTIERPSSVDPEVTQRRVLVLPSTGADGLAMGRLFEAHRISFAICRSAPHLFQVQREGAGALIVAEEVILADPAQLLRCIQEQPVWSDLPVIVLSRSGRESTALSRMVLYLGNVSVVERPVRTSTLLSLVRSSLRARDRQYQMREYLAYQERIKTERDQLLDSERAARSEAERASRTKDEFLATLSHELRTPLHAILGWTQVLRKAPALTDDVAKGLVVIERNARSQAQIIEDLLDMSSIISGKVRLDVQQLDIASVVTSTIETVRPAALAKGVRLQVVLDPSAPQVRGDPNRLQQVLWNLLTNAVKFTSKDGRVTVTLARVNSHLEIEVADDGEGIDPAFLPQVFDRFRQADASSARRHGGLGLGLSIVKQLVELHGGTITATSAGPGEGATFRVSLPFTAAAADPQDAQAPSQHAGKPAYRASIKEIDHTDLKAVKVLVVDDDRDARSLIQRILQDSNAVVATASSADEAMQALVRDAPDVLVSDIGMPGEDGYTLIRRVRALEGAPAAVPAIALTAYARTEDQAKAIHAGFQSHLAKPVEPIELVAMVESLARR